MPYKTKGYAAHAVGQSLSPFEFTRRDLGPKDVALKISYAGICHSDIHTVRGEWGSVLTPCVPGHEIVGTVTDIGKEVTKFAVGELIGVGVFIDSCRICTNCKNGLGHYCFEGMTGTYNSVERDGISVAQGGYSNFFVIDEDFAVHIPDNLSLPGVAPLMCAGITLYSPLRHWGAGPGKKVGIIGLGGLGHMGVKFAHAMGADVTVFSHSPEKEEDARRMGANNFIVTKDSRILKEHQNQFDLLLNTVSAEMDLEPYIKTLRLDGTLVVIGLPGKPYAINAGPLLEKRRSISGSMIGGYPELQEMIDFCGEHNIISDVEVIDPEYINQAYERTIASDIKYRFVIDATKF